MSEGGKGGAAEVRTGYAALAEPAALLTELAFLLLSSTSPAQRLGTTRRLHSGLATCERGVRVGGAGLCGRGREGAKAEKGDHLMESSVQVRKPATEGATARLQRAAPT